MSRMIEITRMIVDLKRQRMEINFTPVSKRAANYITLLRTIRIDLMKLETERHQLLNIK